MSDAQEPKCGCNNLFSGHDCPQSPISSRVVIIYSICTWYCTNFTFIWRFRVVAIYVSAFCDKLQKTNIYYIMCLHAHIPYEEIYNNVSKWHIWEIQTIFESFCPKHPLTVMHHHTYFADLRLMLLHYEGKKVNIKAQSTSIQMTDLNTWTSLTKHKNKNCIYDLANVLCSMHCFAIKCFTSISRISPNSNWSPKLYHNVLFPVLFSNHQPTSSEMEIGTFIWGYY